MTVNPVRAHAPMSLGEAARIMEDRPSQISVLPVTDAATNRCLGLIRIHDIYQAGIVSLEDRRPRGSEGQRQCIFGSQVSALRSLVRVIRYRCGCRVKFRTRT